MKVTILIVEDNRSTAMILENYIKKYFEFHTIDKYSIEIVSNGQDAINKLTVNSYDLVFLDVIIPKIDGYGVLEFIKEKMDNKDSLYICMTTAMYEDDTDEEFIQKGATSFIGKPYNKNMIFLELDKYFENCKR